MLYGEQSTVTSSHLRGRWRILVDRDNLDKFVRTSGGKQDITSDLKKDMLSERDNTGEQDAKTGKMEKTRLMAPIKSQ